MHVHAKVHFSCVSSSLITIYNYLMIYFKSLLRRQFKYNVATFKAIKATDLCLLCRFINFRLVEQRHDFFRINDHALSKDILLTDVF